MVTPPTVPSANAVADYVLGLIDPDAGDSITNLKMQKLLYYVQGWHLALLNRPAFRERIEAWAKGPVVPTLWRRFYDDSNWGVIDPTKLKTKPMKELPGDTRHVIDDVWFRYGDFQGSQLQHMTHKEDPWVDARADALPGERSSAVITNDAMKKYFKSRLKNVTHK